MLFIVSGLSIPSAKSFSWMKAGMSPSSEPFTLMERQRNQRRWAAKPAHQARGWGVGKLASSETTLPVPTVRADFPHTADDKSSLCCTNSPCLSVPLPSPSFLSSCGAFLPVALLSLLSGQLRFPLPFVSSGFLLALCLSPSVSLLKEIYLLPFPPGD